jgi:hypothetical protein
MSFYFDLVQSSESYMTESKVREINFRKLLRLLKCEERRYIQAVRGPGRVFINEISLIQST